MGWCWARKKLLQGLSRNSGVVEAEWRTYGAPDLCGCVPSPDGLG